MLFELALLSVAIPAGYWGALYLWRRPFGSATYGHMLVATAVLAIAALVARRSGGPDLDVVGAIALGAGVCLLVVAPVLRTMARWAVNSERLALAAALIEVRDLLQPGTGGREERVLVRALRDVRDGRVDDAVEALVAVRPHATPPGRRRIDERIALLYLSAHRFRDAVDHVERTLLADASAPGVIDPTARLTGLPMSAGLYAELVGAYGRLGELDRAAAIADELDRRAAGASELVFLVHRVRLMLLAFAGEVAAVDRLVAPAASAHMTPAARIYWGGVARERSGDRDGARRAYDEALARARREPRARDVIRRALDELELEHAPQPVLSPVAADVARRLAGSDLVMPAATAASRRWVTPVLVAVNLGAAAAVGVLFGSAGDVGAIIRAGASLHGAVVAGEWWRLPASTFLHLGLVHLGVNILALWVLGRMAETIFGPLRLLAIYLAAGIGGAVASHALMTHGVSAGASGAVFGLLGALLVELVLHRRQHGPAWRRGLVSALAFTTAANLAIGFLFDVIDNGAHLGGLAAGVVVAVLVSPHARWRAAGTALAAIITAAGVAASVAAAVMAVTTDFDDTLARSPRIALETGGLVAEVPATWSPDQGALVDDDGLLVLTLSARGGQLADRWPAWITETGVTTRDQGFTDAGPARRALVPVPDGWVSVERMAVVRDALGTEQRMRVISFGRAVPAGVALGSLFVPDVLAASGSRELARIIASVRPADDIGPPPAP